MNNTITDRERQLLKIVEFAWRNYEYIALDNYLLGVTMALIWCDGNNDDLIDDIRQLLALNHYR